MPLSSREVMRLLHQDGWRVLGVSGSHHQLIHPDKPGRVTVQHPRKDIPIGTLKQIEKQSGLKLRK